MSNWQALRAARTRRELKREKENAAGWRGKAMQASRERDDARNAPIARLREAALDYIGARAGDAALVALDPFTRQAIEAIRSQGIREMSLSVTDGFEDRAAIVRVVIPQQVRAFAVDMDAVR